MCIKTEKSDKNHLGMLVMMIPEGIKRTRNRHNYLLVLTINLFNQIFFFNQNHLKRQAFIRYFPT